MLEIFSQRRDVRRAIRFGYILLCAQAVASTPVLAQTDFANTDAGRPFRTQDALALERLAFEWHLPAFRVLSHRGSATVAFDPAISFGVLPRTQLEAGFSVASRRRGTSDLLRTAERKIQLDDIHVGALHQLNVETLTVPAIALGADLELPVADDDAAAVWSGVAAVTRTWGNGVRSHLNARVTSSEAAPWELGLAVDRTLPLRHLLVGVEVGATRADVSAAEKSVIWRSGAGFRWQWTVQTGIEAGIERRFTRDIGWSFSLGMSRAFGIRALAGGLR